MDVRRVPLTALHPDPQNARRHSARNIAEIQASLVAFGQQKPLVVTQEGMILAGNGTWEAAKRLGWTEIEVNYGGLEDAPGRAYSVADNRTAELAVWDEGELKAALEGLQAAGQPLIGWEPQELAALTGATPSALQDVEPQLDRAEALREQWGVEVGQLWQLGRHRVLCGDCTDQAQGERLLEGKKVGVVTDPPYGIQVDTSWLSVLNVQHGKPPNASDDRLRGDDGSLDLSWLFRYKEWLVFGFPHLARYEPYTGLLVWDKRGDGGENGLGSPVEVAASNAFTGYRLRRHVWAGYVRAADETRHQHPTQKPVGILVDALSLVHAVEVFDPFLGSGTTLIACEQLGRQCYGLEIAPAYVAVTLQRWADLTGQAPTRVV